MEENPILSEYKAKLMMFKKLENSIDDIQVSETVGPIELFTGNPYISVCPSCIFVLVKSRNCFTTDRLNEY
jgi:hypothetical protein